MSEPTAPADPSVLDPTTCDIDTLMAHIAEINAKDPPLTAPDINALITYYRRNRAYRAAGGKAKAPSPSGPGLSDLLARIGKPAPSAKPIATGTVRRV